MKPIVHGSPALKFFTPASKWQNNIAWSASVHQMKMAQLSGLF
jgi:hypothetical protein